MSFEWDEEKRRRNLRNHGIDFVEAKAIWSRDVLEYPSDQIHHGEQRFLAVGELDERVITVVFTWRGKVRRLISARKARRNERKDYENGVERRS